MLIGLMSDSHDDYLAVRYALQVFDRLGVSHIIHCGDVGGQQVFDEVAGRRFSFVWGNTDYVDYAIDPYFEAIGLTTPDAVPLILELDGKKFAVFHGHEDAFIDADMLDVDFVLHGHTHERRDEQVNGMRFINPGALHRVRVKTVATLDTQSGKLVYHEIDQD